MYLFAISGLLIFEKNNASAALERAAATDALGPTDALASAPHPDHPGIEPDTPPPGNGQCATLLQCFISYSYRGINMQGLSDYLDEPVFAKELDDLMPPATNTGSGRLLWVRTDNVSTVLVSSSLLCSS